MILFKGKLDTTFMKHNVVLMDFYLNVIYVNSQKVILGCVMLTKKHFILLSKISFKRQCEINLRNTYG